MALPDLEALNAALDLLPDQFRGPGGVAGHLLGIDAPAEPVRAGEVTGQRYGEGWNRDAPSVSAC